MKSRVRRWLTIWLAAAVVFGVARRYASRSIPFDSLRWRDSDSKVRYRMKDSLREKYSSGDLATREAVDKALGPDDDGADLPRVRQFQLESPGLGFPWYILIRFDDQGKTSDFVIAPQ